jgi:hypothetical protein
MLLFYGLLMLMLEKGSGDCLNGKMCGRVLVITFSWPFGFFVLLKSVEFAAIEALDHELIIGGFVRFQWKGEVAVLFTMDNHFI